MRLPRNSQRCPPDTGNDFTDRRSEFAHSGPGNDDSIAAAVRFLGNTEKFATLVFAELNMEMLPFDLNVFGFEDVVHFPSSRG